MRRPQSSTLSTLSTQEQVLSVELSTTCGNSEAGGGEKASEQDSAPGNLQRCRALLFFLRFVCLTIFVSLLVCMGTSGSTEILLSSGLPAV